MTSRDLSAQPKVSQDHALQDKVPQAKAPQLNFDLSNRVARGFVVREPRDNDYKLRAQLGRWLREIPVEFPSSFESAPDLPALFNPLIGNQYKDTCANVRNILEMLRNMTLSKSADEADFSLSKEGALGFVCLLHSMTSALKFELNYRNNDYESSSS